MPVSETSIQAFFPVTPASTEMVPPSGVYLMELPTTFIITCSRRLRSPTIRGRWLRSPQSSSWPRCRAFSALERTTLWIASAKGNRERTSSASPRSSRERVSRSWTMWVIRSVSVMMMSRKLLAVAWGMSPSASRRVSA